MSDSFFIFCRRRHSLGEVEDKTLLVRAAPACCLAALCPACCLGWLSCVLLPSLLCPTDFGQPTMHKPTDNLPGDAPRSCSAT